MENVATSASTSERHTETLATYSASLTDKLVREVHNQADSDVNSPDTLGIRDEHFDVAPLASGSRAKGQ
jgi:hypothetical protein